MKSLNLKMKDLDYDRVVAAFAAVFRIPFDRAANKPQYTPEEWFKLRLSTWISEIVYQYEKQAAEKEAAALVPKDDIVDIETPV